MVRTGGVGVQDWLDASKDLTICAFAPSDGETAASGPSSEFTNFENLARKLFAVPKSQIEPA